MKKYFKQVLAIASIMMLGTAFGQIEAKINPVGMLFGNFDFIGEYGISDDFGVDLTATIITGTWGAGSVGDIDPKRSGFGVMLYGKYYFSPDYGYDRFYAGIYLRQRGFKIEAESGDDFAAWERDFFAVGFGAGYKIVSKSNIIGEIGFGIGRTLSESNKWSDSNNEGDSFPSFGIDGFSRLAIGYRF